MDWKEKKINLLLKNAGVHLLANLEETGYEQPGSMEEFNLPGTYYLLKKFIPIIN